MYSNLFTCSKLLILNINIFTSKFQISWLQGRRSVRYGDFQYCEQAKSVIVVSNLKTCLHSHFFIILKLVPHFGVYEHIFMPS